MTVRRNRDESLAGAVTRIRRQILGHKSELSQLRAAPLTSAEIKTKITGHINQMAEQGRPYLNLEGGVVDVRFADVPAFGDGALMAPAGAASKLLAWLFRDELISSLTRGSDNIEGGIAASERPKLEAVLDSKILALEHQEEALVVEALSQGLECNRRLGCNILAILGLEPTPIEELAAQEAAE